MFAFVNRTDRHRKPLVAQSLQLLHLLFDRLLVFSAFDLAAIHRVYDVLHKLSPFHIAVTIDVDLLK